VSLLSHRVAQGELVAALLAYRAIYQLGPLLLAAIWLVFVDTRARGKAGAA
jgi:uncharacterized membrane protein YbhN (UPF0104 family)